MLLWILMIGSQVGMALTECKKVEGQILSTDKIKKEIESSKLSPKKKKELIQEKYDLLTCLTESKVKPKNLSDLIDLKTILSEILDFDCDLSPEAIKLRINSAGASTEYYDLEDADFAEKTVATLCKK